MKCNYRHEVYRTGSVSGYVERDREDYTPKKFTYIKIKADRYYYLGEGGKLVNEAHAAPFTPQTACQIIMSIKKDARYKKYTAEVFETSKRLSDYIVPFNEAPQDLIKMDNTSKADSSTNEQIEIPVVERQSEKKPAMEQINSEPNRKQAEQKDNINNKYNDRQQFNKNIFIAIGVGIFVASVIIAIVVSLI